MASVCLKAKATATAVTRPGTSGPDLTDIGARRGPAYLRTAIVDPEAEVPENFASYRKLIYRPDNFLCVRVVTNDGKQIAGVRVDEDTVTIQIPDGHDRLYSFRKDELRELNRDWGESPMPSYKTSYEKRAFGIGAAGFDRVSGVVAGGAMKTLLLPCALAGAVLTAFGVE